MIRQDNLIKPRALFLEITSNCNMNCPMCITHEHKKNKKPELTANQIKKHILEYGNKIGIKQLIITGGEPTLAAHLYEIIQIDTDDIISRSRLRNQADFYSLFGAFSQLIDEDYRFDYAIIKQRLIDFISILDNESERSQNNDASTYFEHTRTASNRTTARKERQEILVRVIKG